VTHNTQCSFCTINPARIIVVTDYAMAIIDGFPISPGHTLIIPKRHIASLFEATAVEREALFDLLADMRKSLMTDRNPNGFNIGINEGADAGQTVMHLHIHLIPRYTGDMPDPRGGIRWIFPDKAAYWEK
jgi:diadenosine tetraphosphate (Ap4A) HIT family hydrolase